MKKKPSCCEDNLPIDQAQAQEGDRFTCPRCKTIWVHVCDEDEGCFWTLFEMEVIGGRK